MFFDSHCHLDYFSYDEVKRIIEGCRNDKVKAVVTNGINHKTNLKTIELSFEFPEIKAAIGVYPIEALKLSENELEKEINFIKKNKEKIVAVGEVGMDFKESNEIERQTRNFEKFIELSKKIDKTIIVHSRKAERECIEILEKLGARKVLMHCFCGNMKLVEKIIKNEWYMSIPTNVKFSTQFQEIVKKVPIKKLLCETDSPYLHPNKEFPNKPQNVIESYKKIAEIKNLTLSEVEKNIEENYLSLFGRG